MRRIDIIQSTSETLRGLVARPLLIAAPAMISGIIIAEYASALASSLLVALCVTLLVLIAAYRKRSWAVFPVLVLFCLVIGIASHLRIVAPVLGSGHISHLAGQRLRVEGVVAAAPEHGQRSTQVSLALDSCKAPGEAAHACHGKFMLYVRERAMPWRAGDRVAATLTLRAVSAKGNPGEFDYAAYLMRRGYFVRGFLHRAKSLEIIATWNGEGGALVAIERMRSRIAAWIEGHAGADDAEIFKALLLGMRRGIARDIRDAFLQAGTSHLLAISGMHMGVMAFWCYLLAGMAWRRLPGALHYFSAEQAAAGVTLVFTWIYALLAGLQVATCRAAIMISIYMLARLVWSKGDSLNSLASAAIVILLIWPYVLFEAAFQLSFLAVAAILTAAPRLMRLQSDVLVGAPPMLRNNPALRYLGFVLVSSLVCFLATAPVVAHWFHAIPLNGVWINMLVVPVFSLLLVPMLGLALICWTLGVPGASLLLDLASLIFHAVFAMQKLLCEWFGGLVHVPRVNLWVSLAYLLALALLVMAFERGQLAGRPLSRLLVIPFGRKVRVWLGLVLMVAVGLGLAYGERPVLAGGRECVVVPHIEDGLSVAVFDSDGQVQLVSAGRIFREQSDPVRRVLAPMIWDRGKRRVARVWRVSRSDAENKAIDRLSDLLDVGETRHVFESGRCSRKAETLARCRLDPLDDADNPPVVWRLGAYRKGARRVGGMPVLDFALSGAHVLIVPYPHRISPEQWREFSQNRPEGALSVVLFGPGKIESTRALLDALQPVNVVMAMNRHMSRYIRRSEYAKLAEEYPNISRSDDAGALVLDAFGRATLFKTD